MSAIAFHSLFCFHGSGESDSEPYLWTIGFTLDGRTVTHTPDSQTLSGGPDFFFSPGSHGDLGGPVSIGSTRTIPPAVGRFDMTLQPIVLTAGGHTLEAPGWIGLIGILLEEDATSDEGAEAAHQAINELVKIEMNEAIADVNLAGLGAEVLQATSSGTDPVAAARVSKLSFPSAIVEGADPDEFMGVSVNIFSQQDLDATQHNDRLEISDRISQPNVHPEAWESNYNLHGAAWRRVEVCFTPITDQVPPGRWPLSITHTRLID